MDGGKREQHEWREEGTAWMEGRGNGHGWREEGTACIVESVSKKGGDECMYECREERTGLNEGKTKGEVRCGSGGGREDQYV